MPSWTKKDAPADHYRMFNARSESVEEKGAPQAAGKLRSVPLDLVKRSAWLYNGLTSGRFLSKSCGLPAGVFNRLLKGHRCVVLLNGFYEWAKVKSPGQKHHAQLVAWLLAVQRPGAGCWQRCQAGTCPTVCYTDSHPGAFQAERRPRARRHTRARGTPAANHASLHVQILVKPPFSAAA